MQSRIKNLVKIYFFIVAVDLHFLLSLSVSAFAYDVYQYTVPDSELRIYPADLMLSMRRQNTALNKIAEQLQTGSSQDIAEFARISLYEMAGLFEEEATRSFEGETIDIKEGARLNRWRRETLAYAQHLYHVADSITPLTHVELYIENTGELYFIIEGDPFILTSPLIRNPKVLDERIINSICQVKSCDPDILSYYEKENTRTITVQASWVMTDKNAPEFATIDGLHFIFSNIKNRSVKQIACLKVIKEMRLIADTLKDANNMGIYIDWDSLNIKPLYGSYDYRIAINHFGDSIYIKLPELHHISGWQNLVAPWLRAQVEDKEYQQYLYADELLAYAL